jgi:predicted MFS family arabinose efflux permease
MRPTLGWRGLFLVPLLGVSVGAALVLRSVPDTGERAPGRINLPAAALLSGGLVALLLPLSLGSTWGWGSPLVIGLFVAAALLLAGWIVVELRSREPLVDMRMMRLPGVWNVNVGAILIGAAMFGVWAFFARFLQEPTSTGYGLGATVGEAGLIMLPMLVLMALAGFFIGPLGRVLTPRSQVIAGSVLIAGSTAAIALFHGAVWELTIAAALFGLGLGLVFAAMTAVVVQSVPPTQTGVATGMNANLRTIGSGIGTALMTAIVTGSAVPGTGAGEPTEAGYATGFLVLAAGALVAAVIAGVSRPRRARAGLPEPLAESPFLDAEAA